MRGIPEPSHEPCSARVSSLLSRHSPVPAAGARAPAAPPAAAAHPAPAAPPAAAEHPAPAAPPAAAAHPAPAAPPAAAVHLASGGPPVMVASAVVAGETVALRVVAPARAGRGQSPVTAAPLRAHPMVLRQPEAATLEWRPTDRAERVGQARIRLSPSTT